VQQRRTDRCDSSVLFLIQTPGFRLRQERRRSGGRSGGRSLGGRAGWDEADENGLCVQGGTRQAGDGRAHVAAILRSDAAPDVQTRTSAVR
jgi:hypothetical protein